MNTNKIYSENIDGFKYDVIVPENVTNDTKIIVYSTSTDDTWNGYSNLKNEILNNNIDAIMVIPTNGWLSSDDYSNGVINAVNKVKNNYGIKYDGYIGSGFSNPSINAVKAFTKYIDDNPNCDRQVLFLNDAVPQTAVKDASGNYHWYDTAITDAEIATLEKNGTFIVDYCRPGTFGNVGDRLLNSNVDILFVCDDNLPSGNWNTQHSYINNKAYGRNGLYSHVIDFIYEDGQLPKGYSYYVYDHETKKINKYTDSALISTIIREKYNFGSSISGDNITKVDLTEYGKDKLNYITTVNFDTFTGQINSDLDYAQKIVNNIMSSVKQYANVLDSGSFSASFKSTTSIPSQIPMLVKKYFMYNVDIIYDLTKLLENIVKTATNYEVVDKKLLLEAEKISTVNDIINVDDNQINVMPTVDINTNTFSNKKLNYTGDIIADSGNYSVNDKNDTYYKKIKNEFLNEDEMHSDNDKIVYVSENDEYKVVIHIDNDKIVGIENYYKYEKNEDAMLAFEKLSQKYAQSSDVYKVVYKDNMVKIIYDKSMFENLTIDQIRKNYADYSEVLQSDGKQ